MSDLNGISLRVPILARDAYGFPRVIKSPREAISMRVLCKRRRNALETYSATVGAVKKYLLLLVVGLSSFFVEKNRSCWFLHMYKLITNFKYNAVDKAFEPENMIIFDTKLTSLDYDY